jgi:alkylation response protein AidB-like acyl-CoA dehydrogenase
MVKKALLGQVGLPGGGFGLGYGCMNNTGSGRSAFSGPRLPQGHNPVRSFIPVARMADMLLEVEQARSAVINAAAAMESTDRTERERALSAAKVTMGRIGALVAEESIQLHGGIGMTWELPLSHYAKRLVMVDHQFGDEDHHLARFIALGQG